MTGVKSYLGNVAESNPTDRRRLRAMAAALFHQRGVIVIWPDEVKNDFDRQHLTNVAEKLYGQRT